MIDRDNRTNYVSLQYIDHVDINIFYVKNNRLACLSEIVEHRQMVNLYNDQFCQILLIFKLK